MRSGSQRGPYRPLPSRRRLIPKADGKPRPLAVAAIEDEIVQRAVREAPNAIYEEDFLGASRGFRPGRGPHDALAAGIGRSGKKGNGILRAGIRSFFDSVRHVWLMRFLEPRIGYARILRLTRKWLKAGVLEDGVVTVGERGTGRGR